MLLLEICLLAGKEIPFSGRRQLSACWVHWGDKRRQNGTCCHKVASVRLFNAWTENEKEMTKAFFVVVVAVIVDAGFFSSFLNLFWHESLKKKKKTTSGHLSKRRPRFHRSFQPEFAGCLDACCICHDQSAIRGKIRATSHWKLADSVLPPRELSLVTLSSSTRNARLPQTALRESSRIRNPSRRASTKTSLRAGFHQIRSIHFEETPAVVSNCHQTYAFCLWRVEPQMMYNGPENADEVLLAATGRKQEEFGKHKFPINQRH